MKRKLFYLIFNFQFLIFNYSYSQPAIQWQKCLGGTGDDRSGFIQQLSNGDYIVGGLSTSNDGDVTGNHGGEDYWIINLSPNGILQWQVSRGGTSSDRLGNIIQTLGGSYIISGSSMSNDGDVTGNHGTDDFWIAGLTTTGSIQWQKSIGGTFPEGGNITLTSDGGYFLSGSSRSNDGDVSGHHGSTDHYDYWVAKLDSARNIQWQRSLGGSSLDVYQSGKLTTDGGYILAGQSLSIDGDVSDGDSIHYEQWIVKLDSSGNISWEKSYGGTWDESADEIQQTSDGGYIVAGFTTSNDGDVTGNHGAADFWIVKLDAAGNLQWQKTLGGTRADIGYSIGLTNDGGYIAAGLSYSDDGDVTGHHGDSLHPDYWVVKLDNNGNIQWQKSLGGTDWDSPYSIQQTDDGGYIVTGLTQSNDGDVTGNHGYNDFWVVKLSSLTGIIEEEENDINAFSIFPNPFTTHTTIKFNKEITEGTLRVYNMFGQMVLAKNDINGKETVIKAEGISSGVYFFEVTEGEKRIYSGKAIIY